MGEYQETEVADGGLVVEITMTNGTICVATRLFGVLSAHDDEGAKTYYVAQIQDHRRRLAPEDVRSVNVS